MLALRAGCAACQNRANPERQLVRAMRCICSFSKFAVDESCYDYLFPSLPHRFLMDIPSFLATLDLPGWDTVAAIDSRDRLGAFGRPASDLAFEFNHLSIGGFDQDLREASRAQSTGSLGAFPVQFHLDAVTGSHAGRTNLAERRRFGRPVSRGQLRSVLDEHDQLQHQHSEIPAHKSSGKSGVAASITPRGLQSAP